MFFFFLKYNLIVTIMGKEDSNPIFLIKIRLPLTNILFESKKLSSPIVMKRGYWVTVVVRLPIKLLINVSKWGQLKSIFKEF